MKRLLYILLYNTKYVWTRSQLESYIGLAYRLDQYDSASCVHVQIYPRSVQ